jgi:hypothetical protein
LAAGHRAVVNLDDGGQIVRLGAVYGVGMHGFSCTTQAV